METFINKKGQPIGYLLKDNIFRRKVQGSKHQLRKPPAWGMDEELFQKLTRRSVVDVRILDTETGTVHRSMLLDWETKGFVQNRGHGEQRFLTLENHSTHDRDESQFAKDCAWFSTLEPKG